MFATVPAKCGKQLCPKWFSHTSTVSRMPSLSNATKEKHLSAPSLLYSMAMVFGYADVIRAKLLTFRGISSQIVWSLEQQLWNAASCAGSSVDLVCYCCILEKIAITWKQTSEWNMTHLLVHDASVGHITWSLGDFHQLSATKNPNALQYTMNMNPNISIFNTLSFTNIYCYTICIIKCVVHTHFLK